jgi:hypothetical protein
LDGEGRVVCGREEVGDRGEVPPALSKALAAGGWGIRRGKVRIGLVNETCRCEWVGSFSIELFRLGDVDLGENGALTV